MALQKNWVIKIFGRDGGSIKKTVVWDTLRDKPSFSCRINGGFGELVLDLVGPEFRFDGFGEGTIIDFTFIVDLYEVDPVNAPLGRRIYRGYISKYEPYIDQGGAEGVRVTCLGLVSLLTKSYYGGFGSTVHSGDDPQEIGEAIIDHYNTVFGGGLTSYTHGTSTEAVGTNVSYTFANVKWFDALEEVRKLSGTNWWWKIDEDGLYWLRQKPSSATHKFVLGRHIDSIQAPKDGEKVVNDVRVTRNGGTSTDYSDATSQATFGTGSPATGKFSELIEDSSIVGATAADQRGNTEVGNFKDAANTALITINPNYDLESIKVGQTCKLLNYDGDSSFFGNNLFIVGLTYNGDWCRVETERPPADFGLELKSFVG